MTKKSHYITTPIYYVNDVPHVGHTYTTVACDIAARYFRQQTGEVFNPADRLGSAKNVFFLTGTDEHGTKVEEAASAKGISPAEFVKSIAEDHFKRAWEEMNLTFNDFIRTDEERHKKVVQGIFKRLMENGDITLSHYEGWYWVSDESFVTETQIKELNLEKDKDVRWTKEESYVFHVEKYREKIAQIIESNQLIVQPASKKKEILSLLKSWPVEPVSVSRTTVSWGIPVPGHEEHTVYVWFDALINYISAIGYDPSKSWDDQPGDFKSRWPADCHMIGKEILKFHAVIWPAILLSLGVPLPKMVFAHGWWTRDGEKMSKSKGNFVRPAEFITRYGMDAFRYYLFQEMPFGNDGDFSEERMISFINAFLANKLGNLLSRTISMMEKYRGGVFRRPPEKITENVSQIRNRGEDGPPQYTTTWVWEDKVQPDLAAQLYDKNGHSRKSEEIKAAFENFEYSKVLNEAFTFIIHANMLIDKERPWERAYPEGDDERYNQFDSLDLLFYELGEVLRITAVILAPIMPTTARKIWEQLGLQGDPNHCPFEEAFKPFGIPDGTTVKKGDALFPRIEPPKNAAPDAKSKSGKPKKNDKLKEETVNDGLITIDDFSKIDLRVATIITAEKHPDADKLLRLEVDDGSGAPRPIVAGIAAYYTPADLVGKQVIIVANLKPVKLRGVESRGMLLAASTELNGEKKLVITGPQGSIAPGSSVK